MEIFKNVVGFPGYQVSNYARVKRLSYRGVTKVIPGKFIKPTLHHGKYLRIRFGLNGMSITKCLAHVVLEAFKDELRNKRVTLYLDENTLNCWQDNLDWISMSDLTKIRIHKLKRGKNCDKVRGVYKSKCGKKKFRSVIKLGSNVVTLGYHETKAEAYSNFYKHYIILHGYAPWDESVEQVTK
jgi:hypothetical protein